MKNRCSDGGGVRTRRQFTLKTTFMRRSWSLIGFHLTVCTKHSVLWYWRLFAENLPTRMEPFVFLRGGSTREPPDFDPFVPPRRRCEDAPETFEARQEKGKPRPDSRKRRGRRHKGRISYVMGRIYTFHIKGRGPPWVSRVSEEAWSQTQQWRRTELQDFSFSSGAEMK